LDGIQNVHFGAFITPWISVAKGFSGHVRQNPDDKPGRGRNEKREYGFSKSLGGLHDCSKLFAGETFGGFGGGGENFDYFVDVGEFQNAFDHAGGAGEAEHASGSFQAGMGFDDLADDGAIDVMDGGEVEDNEFFVARDVLFDVAIDFLAVVAHGDAAGEFQDDDAGVEAFFSEFHVSLFFRWRGEIDDAQAIREEATLERSVRQAQVKARQESCDYSS
jgi:hypothetical protein